MKKSKVIIAIALAIVLLMICVNAPTFSWFTRSEHVQQGGEMMLNTNKAYTAYNGGGNGSNVVSAVTMKSTDGVNYVSSSTADLSSTAASPLDVQIRKYFKTTLTNNTGSPQTVSLYIKKLSIPTSVATTINESGANGTLAIGVNGPTRNYRDYTALTNRNYSLKSGRMKRIYVQISGYLENGSGWGGVTKWANYGCWDGAGTAELHWLAPDDSSNGVTYFFDVPYHTDWAYIAVNGWEKAGTNGGEDKSMRSAQFSLTGSLSSMDQNILIKVKSEQESDNTRKVEIVSSHGVKTTNIKQYYNEITVARGATFDTRYGAQAQDPTAGFSYYDGNCTVSYSSSNTSIFTVNSSGVIRGVAAGEAVLTTRITSPTWSSGNYKEVTTNVKVTQNSTYDFDNAPIVRNVYIPADGGNGENVVDVYWYVINNSSTNALLYSIDEVYVGV